MKVTKKIDGTKLNIELEGRLDTNTSKELEVELLPSLVGIDSVVLDFQNLVYVSSAGLRVLLSAQKVMNKQGEMTLMNVNDMIMEVFEITGFVNVLKIV
jgi:anti-sigma B factor antagonist